MSGSEGAAKPEPPQPSPLVRRALGREAQGGNDFEAPSARPHGWRLSERGYRLVAVAACALAVGVATGNAWAFALAAGPLVWLMLAARPGAKPERIVGTAHVPVRRCFEGETISVRIDLAFAGAAGGLDPAVFPGPGVELTGIEQRQGAVGLMFTAYRWGRWSLGVVDLDVYDRAGLARQSVRVELGDCEVFPLPSDSSLTPIPARLPNRLGEHTSRQRGEGLEFVGVSPFRWGERQRRINWSATTRRGSIQISQFAAEQATDAVVLLDAFGDVVSAVDGHSTLDDSVRAAAGIARAYLRSHDRVGIVSLGGKLRWLTPGTGSTHLLRIVESVLDVRRDMGYQVPDLDRVPPPALPAGALVYAITPLADDRFLEALRDLAERGNPAVVVEIPAGEPLLDPQDPDAPLARRLWRLDREALRFSLTERGMPVVAWDGEGSLDLSLAPLLRRPVYGRAR